MFLAAISSLWNNLDSFIFWVWFLYHLKLLIKLAFDFLLEISWQESFSLKVHRWVSFTIDSSFFWSSMHNGLIERFWVFICRVIQNVFKYVRGSQRLIIILLSDFSCYVCVVLPPNMLTLKSKIVFLLYQMNKSFFKRSKYKLHYFLLIPLF